MHLSSLECVQSLTAINAPMVCATVSSWSLLSLSKWLSAYTGIKASFPPQKKKSKGKGTSLWKEQSLNFLMQVHLLDICSGSSSRGLRTASTNTPKFTFTKVKKEMVNKNKLEKARKLSKLCGERVWANFREGIANFFKFFQKGCFTSQIWMNFRKTSKGGRLCFFAVILTIWQCLSIFDNFDSLAVFDNLTIFLQFLTFCENSDNFWQFWQFDSFWQFLTIWQFLIIFDNFLQFWQF